MAASKKNPSDGSWGGWTVLRHLTLAGLAERISKAIDEAPEDAPLRKVLSAVLSRGGAPAEALVRLLERAEESGMGRKAIMALVHQAAVTTTGFDQEKTRQQKKGDRNVDSASPADAPSTEDLRKSLGASVRHLTELSVREAPQPGDEKTKLFDLPDPMFPKKEDSAPAPPRAAAKPSAPPEYVIPEHTPGERPAKNLPERVRNQKEPPAPVEAPARRPEPPSAEEAIARRQQELAESIAREDARADRKKRPARAARPATPPETPPARREKDDRLKTPAERERDRNNAALRSQIEVDAPSAAARPAQAQPETGTRKQKDDRLKTPAERERDRYNAALGRQIETQSQLDDIKAPSAAARPAARGSVVDQVMPARETKGPSARPPGVSTHHVVPPGAPSQPVEPGSTASPPTLRQEFMRGFWKPYKAIGRTGRNALVGMMPRRVRRAIDRFLPPDDEDDENTEARAPRQSQQSTSRPAASAPSGQAGNTGVPPGSRPAAPAGGSSPPAPPPPGGPPSGGALTSLRTTVVAVLSSLPVIGPAFRRMASQGGGGSGGSGGGGGSWVPGGGGGSGPPGGANPPPAGGSQGGSRRFRAAASAARIAGTVAGLASIATLIGAVVIPALKRFADRTNEANRRLADYNGQLAGSFNRLQIGRFRRDIQTASDTADTGKQLADEINASEAAWQPVRAAWQNLSNIAAEKIAWISKKLGEAASAMIKIAETAAEKNSPEQRAADVKAFWAALGIEHKNVDELMGNVKDIANNTKKDGEGVPGIELLRQLNREDFMGPKKFEGGIAPMWEDDN